MNRRGFLSRLAAVGLAVATRYLPALEPDPVECEPSTPEVATDAIKEAVDNEILEQYMDWCDEKDGRTRKVLIENVGITHPVAPNQTKEEWIATILGNARNV
jgi:hypothetical protein